MRLLVVAVDTDGPIRSLGLSVGGREGALAAWEDVSTEDDAEVLAAWGRVCTALQKAKGRAHKPRSIDGEEPSE